LKETAVAPVNPDPVTVTVVPTGPLVGLKELMTGAVDVLVVVLVDTAKLVGLVALPYGVVTVIGPPVTPLGTVAVSCVFELTVKLAFTPPRVTAVVPMKLEPVTVTVVPAEPLAGVNEARDGAGQVEGVLVMVAWVLPPG
jgi:hypothetical protein